MVVSSQVSEPLQAPVVAAVTGPDTDDAPRVPGRWHTLRGRGITFWVSVSWLALVIFGAVFASVLPLDSPTDADPFNRLLPVGASGHFLGTDHLGRDVLARVVYGSRVSLIVGASSLVIGLLAGGSLGMVAGFIRGRVERLIMWAVDVVLSFPALVLLIALVAFVGRSLANISFALGFLAIPIYARLARAHTLAIGEREFVKAARSIGCSNWRILRRDVLPNVLPALLAYGFIAIGVTIVVEGSLSFLGLSVSAPTPSWGGLIAGGQDFMQEDAALVLIPASVMCLTVLALNMAGDSLRRGRESGAGSIS